MIFQRIRISRKLIDRMIMTHIPMKRFFSDKNDDLEAETVKLYQKNVKDFINLNNDTKQSKKNQEIDYEEILQSVVEFK